MINQIHHNMGRKPLSNEERLARSDASKKRVTDTYKEIYGGKHQRAPGKPHTPEVLERMRANSPKSRVQAPDGTIFPSINEAARQMGVGCTSVMHYCKQGQAQREGKPIVKGSNDLRGWFLLDKQEHKQRPVTTPKGTYESVRAASRGMGVTPPAIIQAIKNNKEGYGYAAEDATVTAFAPSLNQIKLGKTHG